MKSETHELAFITPAFLTGADQGRAELRAPSVRGALRWWFRVLGGTKAEEAEVFGGVQGGARKSKVIVRTAFSKPPVHAPFKTPPPMSDLGYLYYFATVSGETKGIRIRPEAYFAPGTTFEIEIVDQGVPDTLKERLDFAVECFLHLGALGLRATRGCGAFAETSALLAKSEFAEWARRFPPKYGKVWLVSDEVFPKAERAQQFLGGYLRNVRRENHLSGKAKTALGYADRQSSALKLRPVRVKEGFLAAAFYSDAACSAPSVAEEL